MPSFKKLSSSRSDDWIDRMNHIYSVFLLVIFAVLVSTGQFVGDPIHCWCPAQFTGAFEAYTKNYCWIKNTYFIPMMDTIPVDIHKRQDAEITYYQWVPLILLFQVGIFDIVIGFIRKNMSVKCIPPYTPLLYSENGVCRDFPIFLIFAPKHRLWVLVRIASPRRF